MLHWPRRLLPTILGALMLGPVFAQELPQRVTLRVEAFPQSKIYQESVSGQRYLGLSGTDIEVEPPFMTDAKGKVVQYTTGFLVLKAEQHNDLQLTLTSEDWAKKQLPVSGGLIYLQPSSLVASLKDKFALYPWLLLALPLLPLGAWKASRWRKQAVSGQKAISQLVKDLDTQGDPLLGRLLGQYKVVARIGQGGMGAVYRVVDGDGGSYAAKVVYFREDEGLELKRFRREFNLLRQLNHPGLVRAFDYGETSGMAYCILELLVGDTLSRYVQPGGLSWATVWPWVRQILEALSFAHSHSIVHRDLKPGNIMLCAGTVKILDFGLARQSDLTAVTVTGQAMGTPTYISPEQLLSSGTEVDPRSDLYSLGIMIFELLTGQPPFEAEDIQTLLTQHATVPAPPVSKFTSAIPDGLDQVILTMLAKSPINRQASAQEVLVALKELEFAPLIGQGPADPRPATAGDDEATINLPRSPKTLG